METKVLERLKPKAASFGFNEEELKTAAKYIAGSLSAEATDEMIDTAIDQFAPILGLSQKASQRIFSKMEAQFKKDHPENVPPKNEPTPPAPPTPPTPPAPPTNEPADWFKTYKEQQDAELNKLREQLEKMSRDKANEGFSARALEGLKDIDKNYYELMLKGRQFNSNEEVDTFVGEVKDGWNKLAQANGIKIQTRVTPPGGGDPPSNQPSQAVLDRIKARESMPASSAIRGLGK